MYSADTIRTPPMGPAIAQATGPSAMTPRTQEQVSRAAALGATLKRYYLSLASLLGAAGLTLGSVLSGIGIKDWLERWGFWPTFALSVLGVLLAILIQMRQAQKEAIDAIERRADQQLAVMDQQAERRDQRAQEMVELIMERHTGALDRVAESVDGLAGRIEAIEQRMDEATGKHRRSTLPPTPPAGKG